MNDTAVILAAGRGLRLRPYSDGIPKAMVPVAGRPVLERVIEALHKNVGVNRVVIVTGYLHEHFKTLKSPPNCKVETVINERWAETNSMYSLALGMDRLSAGGFIIEGDCCFDQRLLAAAKKEAQNQWFVRPFESSDDGCCLRTNDAGVIEKLTIEPKGVANKTSPNAWKSCGVLKISGALAMKMSAWLRAGIAAGREKDYYDLILADNLAEAALHATDIGSAPWCEIDDERDLARAEQLFSRA